MARRISETKHEHRLLVSNYFYPDPFVLEYFFLLQKLQKNYHRSSLAHTAISSSSVEFEVQGKFFLGRGVYICK